MASTLVLEDGLGSLLLEDGLGYVLLESSPRGRQVRAVLIVRPSIQAEQSVAPVVTGTFQSDPAVKSAFDVFEEW